MVTSFGAILVPRRRQGKEARAWEPEAHLEYEQDHLSAAHTVTFTRESDPDTLSIFSTIDILDGGFWFAGDKLRRNEDGKASVEPGGLIVERIRWRSRGDES